MMNPETPSTENSGNGLGLLLGGLLLLILAVVAWRLPHLMRAIEEVDQLGPEAFKTNGFALPEELLNDPDFLRWGAPGQIIAVDLPKTWGQDKVEELSKNFRKRFLVSSSEVVGITFGGQSRAYPLRLLQWHEVVNDVVGGKPICVVYHPLSETIAVFERTVNASGETPPLFGNSGLVLDCCLLINDRLGQGMRSQESLWSPLDGSALSGPRKGEALQFLPFTLTTWENWLETAPDTDVMAMLENHRNYYKKEPYLPYRQRDLPKYPYSPKAPAGPKNLDRVIVSGSGSKRQGVLTADLQKTYSSESPFLISSWFATHAREIPVESP